MSIAMRMVGRATAPPPVRPKYRRGMASVLSTDRDTVSVDLYGPAGRSAWMDIDWRAHQRWVTVAGRAMNVIDIGPGANAGPARGTMVFVHGLSGSWQNWLEQLPVFAAQGWRCV